MKLFAILLASLTMSFSAVAADAAKGEQALKKNQCASCHGDNYIKSTDNSIPKLAGQHQDYLVQALRQYKVGENKNAALSRNNAIMTGQAKKLSNTDIDNIAAYLSHLPGELSVRK
jgi:cytochrome c553